MSSQSQSSPLKVIVFGATGTLGSALITGLTSNDYKSKFAVSAVVRGETIKDEKKSSLLNKYRLSGVNIVEGDITQNTEQLANLISGNEIVISTVTYPNLLDVQKKLIDASKLSKTAQFFIPSEYGFDTRQVNLDGPVPVFKQKTELNEYLKSSGLNYILIGSGFFLEFFFSPFGGIDVQNNKISAPFNVNSKVTPTSLKDIGLLTAELLVQRNSSHVKNQYVLLGADTVSYKEIHQLLEEKFKKSFTLSTISEADAQKEVDEDKTWSNWLARFRIYLGVQTGIHWDHKTSFPAKFAPHIKLTSVKDYINSL